MGWKSVSPAARASLSLPPRLRQVHHRAGKLVRLEQAGVVDDPAAAGRHTHPLASCRAVLRLHRRQGGGIEGSEQAPFLEVLEGRGVLGVDDVGRRPRPLLDDLIGEDVLVLAADVHVDARLLLEGPHQRIGGLHVLAVVQRDGRPRRRCAAATAGEDQGAQEQTDTPRQRSASGQFPHQGAPLRAAGGPRHPTSAVVSSPNIRVPEYLRSSGPITGYSATWTPRLWGAYEPAGHDR